jgi:hypothetical protein
MPHSSSEDTATLQAQVASLHAQVAALQQQLDGSNEAEALAAPTTPTRDEPPHDDVAAPDAAFAVAAQTAPAAVRGRPHRRKKTKRNLTLLVNSVMATSSSSAKRGSISAGGEKRGSWLNKLNKRGSIFGHAAKESTLGENPRLSAHQSNTVVLDNWAAAEERAGTTCCCGYTWKPDEVNHNHFSSFFLSNVV